METEMENKRRGAFIHKGPAAVLYGTPRPDRVAFAISL